MPDWEEMMQGYVRRYYHHIFPKTSPGFPLALPPFVKNATVWNNWITSQCRKRWLTKKHKHIRTALDLLEIVDEHPNNKKITPPPPPLPPQVANTDSVVKGGLSEEIKKFLDWDVFCWRYRQLIPQIPDIFLSCYRGIRATFVFHWYTPGLWRTDWNFLPWVECSRSVSLEIRVLKASVSDPTNEDL